MYLQAKNTLKSNHYYILKHLPKYVFVIVIQGVFKKYYLFKKILKYFLIFLFLILTHKKHQKLLIKYQFTIFFKINTKQTIHPSKIPCFGG